MSRRDYAVTIHQETFHYKVEDVENGDDDEVFDIAEALEVDLAGLVDMDGIRQRIIMHIEKENGNYKTQTIDKLLDINREDDRKRKKIIEMLKETQKTLKKFEVKDVSNTTHGKRGSAALEELLVTEGATKNFEIDFNQRISQVANGECMIVVSGETSAGKSSFLNLLLGEDILPVHHNPCTSVITKISYGTKRRASILYLDGVSEEIEDIHKGEMKERLWSKIYVTDLDSREKTSRVREVRLSLPMPMLKGGIVLVDSPGIGENPAMDSVIASFVSQHHIMGFIYVIKSDHAGGVDEDRLGSLLKVIIDKQKKVDDAGHGTLFDPKCAIFVCNLWDFVKTEEREKVYDYAVRKLENYWPGLVKTSVIRFSAKRAKEELALDKDYITRDYKMFLDCLKELVAKATDKRLKSTYKWMETVLIRSVHHLKTIVKSIDDTEQHLKVKMKDVHEKLQRLRLKSETVLRDQKCHIDTSVKEICQLFAVVLRQEATHFRLVHFLKQDLTNIDDSDTWPDIKKKIQHMLLERISDEFMIWEEKNNKCQAVEQEIFNQIKLQLHILQEDLHSIEGELHSDTDSVSSDEYDLTARRRSSVISLKLRKMGDFDFDVLHSNPLPVKLVSKFLHPLDTLTNKLRQSRIFGTIENVRWNKKVESYRKEPSRTAQMIAEKFLQQFLNSEGECDRQLFKFVSEILNRPRELLEVIEKNIPSLIQSNEDLLDNISHWRINATESRETYERMMEDLENLKHHLLEYGSGNIFVDDFMGREIRLRDAPDDYHDSGKFRCSEIILTCSTNSQSSKRVPRGIWTALQNANLYDEKEKNGDKTEPIFIKVYLPLCGIDEPFKEITKLRFLDHPHVAKFLGVHHSDAKIPAFIYMDHMRSLKVYKNSTFQRLQDEVPRMLMEVVEGVEYLHSKKLVHMELNSSTITVDFQGTVKLTGGCLPRVATFPMDKESIGVGDFVYLSPDVLSGELYITCADIYALGLLFYEMFLNLRCFDNQRAMTLDLFTSKVDPVAMNKVPEVCDEANMTESTKNLILWCLDISAAKRPTIQIVADKAKEFKSEPCTANVRRSVFSDQKRHKALRRNTSKNLLS